MDVSGLAELIEAGDELFAIKLFTTAVHFLWIYDYLLTLGDEVKYAWNGRRSWVFLLFIANRYSPIFYIVWSSFMTFGYTSSLCKYTIWLGAAHTTVVAVLSQVTIALRIRAVTERNKWVGGALVCLIATQLASGIWLVVWLESHPVQQLPDIPLDPFKICISESPEFGQLFFINAAVAFDVFAFLVLIISAKRNKHPRYPGMPSILDAIVRDATIYFIFTFLCQLLPDLFILFAPNSIKPFPGLASIVLISLMASRLMLSLKKASLEPPRVWSPSGPSQGVSLGTTTLRFASQIPNALRGILRTPNPSNSPEEGISLGSISQSTQKSDRGY